MALSDRSEILQTAPSGVFCHPPVLIWAAVIGRETAMRSKPRRGGACVRTLLSIGPSSNRGAGPKVVR
jgi:hypothetical protein